MEITFNEIKSKEIICTFDGKRLGRATDIVFSKEENKVMGLVVPGEGKFLRKANDVFIPIENIEKIGDDVILVKAENGIEIKNKKEEKQNARTINSHQNESFVRFKKAKIK